MRNARLECRPAWSVPLPALLVVLFLVAPLEAVEPQGGGETGDVLIPVSRDPFVSGSRVEISEEPHGDPIFMGYNSKFSSIVRPNNRVQIAHFGYSLDSIIKVAYTTTNCSDPAFEISAAEFNMQSEVKLVINAEFTKEKETYRLCLLSKRWTEYRENTDARVHISTDIPPKTYYFPFWVQVLIVSVLLVLSGLFSGLNLGLMALSPQELMLIQKSGSKTERRYAETILPVREKGNLLLCSLLIGNVCVNSGISILLDDLTGSGYVALVASSAGIVIFGEIFPQSLCVKKGLAVGARTIWLTRFFMVLTFPIAFPISCLLDFILGDEVVAYDRKRLMELIKMSTRNEDGLAEELKIAVGAMEISDKKVVDVMTKIDDVFMLPDTTTLNTKTVAEILRMGYTRIPVYSGDRNNVVSLLFVKDLALLDPDDNFTIQTVCNYHKHTLRFVLEETPLRCMLEEFKKGDYHLAMVQKYVQDEEVDPYYDLIGVVTLEDIVEEILQAEIVDETDAVTDNVHRIRRKGGAQGPELACLLDTEESRVISVQMQIVTVQWLSTNHRAFHSDTIAPSILEKLVRQHVRRVELSHLPDIYDKKAVIPRNAKLFTKNEYSEKFILILEGRAIVTIGQDGMTFEAGPWHVFGTEMLTRLIDNVTQSASVNHSRASLAGEAQISGRKMGFVPDFTAVVLDDCTFLEVSAHSWQLAYKTTQLSRGGTARASLAEGDASRLVNGRSGSHSSLHEKGDRVGTGVLRHASYVTPQHDAIRRVKQLETKPRSASESEHLELLPRKHFSPTSDFPHMDSS